MRSSFSGFTIGGYEIRTTKNVQTNENLQQKNVQIELISKAYFKV